MLRLTSVRDGDRGAIAMIVAMLFGFGVMIGLAALTIDVGNINADRRQLQNGADAAALAVVQQCIKDGTCILDATTLPNLQKLVDANAADGATEIRRVGDATPGFPEGTPAICGHGPGLPECPDLWALSTENLQECPSATLPSGVKYVRVYTETKDANTSAHILPYSFGAAIAGVGSGADQQTCASVAFGPPTPQGPTLPLAISACEWFRATHTTDDSPVFDPTKYASPPTDSEYPQYRPSFPDSFEQALVINAPLLPATDPCYEWQGHDFPGGFGWLDRSPAPDCQANVDDAGWVGVITGAGGGSAEHCADTIQGYVGHVVHLPAFDCMSIDKIGPGPTPACDNTDNGSHSNYHIQTTAAFFITALDISSVSASIDDGHVVAPSDRHPTSAARDACDAKGGTGSKCMYGWFVQATGDGGYAGGDDTPDYGDSVIQQVG